ncbi:hypothetical protein NLG97_g4445 [Lecanicillium saksenae]|uniref:Uncharacterized protein n=1 Tax=Lecanicillium saksenae TaxID=468837 RepID=A0ACC1QVF9_9HYPO|nr:hypothetical protein NLG97_g4445 [Lecanicillium saksenae]
MQPSTEHAQNSVDATSRDGEGVGTELTDKGTIRQKRWAPRGRTGCLTCRARRVKCDEGKPACRRCLSRGLYCRGYESVTPATIPIALQAPPQNEDDQDDIHARIMIQKFMIYGVNGHEPEPPDWELMEAARYYLHHIARHRQEQLMTQETVLPPCHGRNRAIFLLDVSSHRIAIAYKSGGRQIKANEKSSIGGACASHSRQMVFILSIINAGIRGDLAVCDNARALRGIFTILLFDLMVDARVWHAHILGYLALVQHMGGVRAVMSQNDKYIDLTQRSVLTIALVINTTSPASNQLRGFEAYTDNDVIKLVNAFPRPGFPFPPLLIIALKNLTQLRVRVAEASCTKQDVDITVRSLFRNVNACSAEVWAKTMDFEIQKVAATFAGIFQAAVLLYGILSLPRSAIASWAIASGHPVEKNMTIYECVRVSHRRKLLKLLYAYKDTFRSLLALNWPLAVAGASLGGDGNTEDRDFISESLLDIWKNPLSQCGPILCLEKLRAFWASGKTAWDDCFYEPTPSLA